MAIDKKSKKRLEVLNKKLDKLKQQLAGAKQQEDEPGEVAALEKQMKEIMDEMHELKK